MKAQAYLIFHLNLAFSSISEESRPEVIQRCYWPLLQLVKAARIPIGIELTGWTLERIRELDADWVDEFRRLLHEGSCELIGSGYTQMIGPLVPHEVNQWNQRLGLDAYRRELGIRPRIVLVNEMAFSSSMVDVYHEAGYQGFIMDRDNVRLALGIENQSVSDVPTHGAGPGGATLPVLWSDSILFQKLQQFAHGDIRQDDYLDYLRRRIASGESLLPLYCNDAEVFDFRPGRFREERPTHTEGEWHRLERLLGVLTHDEGLAWCSPTDALLQIESSTDRRVSSLVSVAQPIPVKKQAKYNVSRWAVTGRNNTWLNTMCHRLAGRLGGLSDADQTPACWRTLCELWASDLRTHITAARWQKACGRLEAFADQLGVSLSYGVAEQGVSPAIPAKDAGGFTIMRDSENILLTVETKWLRLILNLRRGLAVHSLAFRSHGFVPITGTLPHGYFNTITLGADFYTGGTVVELPEQHSRITDLERVEPETIPVDDGVCLRVKIPTRFGDIVKSIVVPGSRESIMLSYEFPGWERPLGSIRAGTVTLLPEAFSERMSMSCANGGKGRELFALDQEFDHAAAASSLISCTTGVGASDGEITLGDSRRRLAVSWDPARCAVLPMLVHKQTSPRPLTRLYFSLQELDDTARAGGVIGTFSMTLGAA